MKIRPFTPKEAANIQVLQDATTTVGYLYPTRTGLEKGYMDATVPIRLVLRDAGIHDYTKQGQGQRQHGIKLRANFILDEALIPTSASLYRPKTKKGDPRIWFSRLPRVASPGDLLGIFPFEGSLNVVNLSTIRLAVAEQAGIQSEALGFIQVVKEADTRVANELLRLLEKIAETGPIRAEVAGDTAVGRTLETALGIQMNPRKQPDYKGIELKSYRGGVGLRANRVTLFAKVADWRLSKIKSSGELLRAFGYPRGNPIRLYVTVSALRPNPQTLRLRVDATADRLLEMSADSDYGDVLVWELDVLRQALAAKHKETFWIAATSRFEGGVEFLQYDSVLHTRTPAVAQLGALIAQGTITMDHLIKLGKADKGPLFKIWKKDFALLFPPPQRYALSA